MIPVSSICIPELNDLSCESMPSVPQKGSSSRDYAHEKRVANVAFINDLVAVREQAETGSIVNDKWMYLVKALLACPLPYRPTSKRQIARRTRFNGRWISITYTACRPNVAMTYGADAKLMHWLFDRGLRQAREAEKSAHCESRLVSYRSTNEYLTDLVSDINTSTLLGVFSRPARASRMADTVSAFRGTNSKGSALSRAIRVRNRRTASETVRPRFPSTTAAFFFTALSTRACTRALVFIRFLRCTTL